MLKTIELSNKPALNRNNSNKSASNKNNNNRPVFRKKNGNNEFEKFNVGGNNIEYTKKSEKLFKSRKLKSEKTSKS